MHNTIVTHRITTSELLEHAGERVQLAGWVHRLRHLSRVSFLILRDRHGTAQIVIDQPEIIASVQGLYHESVISVEGVVVASEQAPNGAEIHAPEITIINEATEPPPIDLFRPVMNAQLPTLLDYAPLTLRHPHKRALFKLSAGIMQGFRGTLNTLGFTEIQTPKIVASATESGANVFEIDYFGTPAYLAQSPQFYKQMMVGVFERVYEVGPVFRAEPHSTPRHLNQYVSLDAEFGFIEDHHTVMALLTRLLAGIMAQLETSCAGELALLELQLPQVPEVIPSLHFTEALALIYQETGEDARHEPDLAPHHERWLGEWAQREHNSDFLFITGYPMVKRPFYTHIDPERPEYSNSFDLLFRGLELVTGGQRLHQYADYEQALSRAGMAIEPFESYLQAFRYGMPKHGGFAIGLERFVAQLTGTANVRETTLFPRDMNRLTP